mmetsp:Transcript_22237/g.47829  ORF Transcript_22237/g.47829 Transcript_22237/m.47829 type:complete len:195 (-) Transcript_22237:22-606(-)
MRNHHLIPTLTSVAVAINQTRLNLSADKLETSAPAAVAAEGGEEGLSTSVWRTGGGDKGAKAVVGVRRTADPCKLVAGVEKTSEREGAGVETAPPPSSVTGRGSTPAEMATGAVGGEEGRAWASRVERRAAAERRRRPSSASLVRPLGPEGCGGEERESKAAGRVHRAEEGARKIVAEVTKPPFWARRKGSRPS